MAVLKDLIVHGSSRFLNPVHFTDVKSDYIFSTEGAFDYLKVYQKGQIENLDVTTLKATTARVVESLTVDGDLHTNNWTNSNIATVDGNFYITPTVTNPNAKLTIVRNTASSTIYPYHLTIGGSNWATVQVPGSSGGKKNWTKGCKALVTGDVTVGTVTYPLGTCKGILYTDFGGSGGQVLIDSSATGLNLILNEAGAVSQCNANLKISIYQIYDGAMSTSNSGSSYTYSGIVTTAYRPIGILLTAKGTSANSTFIDVYGGNEDLTTAPSVALADPNVRIGNLDGLDAVGGQTPEGWGIYTTNGYFKGAIVAKLGKIGDGTAAWTIGNDGNSRAYIYSGIQNITTSGSTTGIYVGTNGISNYNSSTQYVNLTGGKITAQGADITGKITASSGSIGGWNIGTDTNKSLYYGNQTPGATTTNLVLSPTSATNSNAIGGSGTGTTWFISAGRVFGVTTAGALYSTSGKIGGWTITDSSIQTGAFNTANTMYFGSSGISLGTTFRVTNAGVLTATSGTIGGYSLTANYLQATDGTTGMSVADNSTTASWAFWAGGNATNTAKFRVDHSGNLYASSATISGSSTIGEGVTIGGKSQSEYLNINVQSQNFSEGTMLFKDPMFAIGVNGTTRYANSGASNVTWIRAAKSSDNPMTGTSYEMVCTNIGSASPGLGGFYWSHQSRKNAIFLYRIIAKIPTGHNLQWATNAIGDSATQVWLTPNIGTGKFTEYVFKVICGSTGSFSTTGFFYIDGTVGTSSAPVTWYIAYATAFDMSAVAEVNNYITNIDSNNGITIKAINGTIDTNTTSGNYIKLNADGMKIYKSGYLKASFGSDIYLWGANNTSATNTTYPHTAITSSGAVIAFSDTYKTAIDSTGMKIYAGSTSYRADISASGLTIYDGNGTADANKIAIFGSTVQVGKKGMGYITIASTGMDIYSGSSNTQLAHIGYDTTNSSTESSSSTSTAPFYSLGRRKPNTEIGYYSMAEGVDTEASGSMGSHAEGGYSVASGVSAHAEGSSTKAIGHYSHAEGNRTQAGQLVYDDEWGTYGLSGWYQHAEGNNTIAYGSAAHAEGSYTEARGHQSHAEGEHSIAKGANSHASGYYCYANGEMASHAMGYSCKTTGYAAIATGAGARAYGSYSHAMGRSVVATGSDSTVIGKFNAVDSISGSGTLDDPYEFTWAAGSDYAFVIGNGTSNTAVSNRSNAFTVKWNGATTMSGALTVNSTSTSSIVAGGRVRANSGSNYEVWMGRGYSDNAYTANRGIYDLKTSEWLIRLGDTNVCVIPAVGTKTSDSSANTRVTTAGALYRSTASSRRYKNNIEDINSIELDPNKLYDLPVRQFKFNKEYLSNKSPRYNINVPGFIAEEVEQIYPIAADYENGRVEDWNVRYMVPPMLKLIQEQHKEIEQLKKEVQELKNK